MSINVNLPSHLHSFTSGLSVAEVTGSTVGECLNDLVRQFPGIERAIFDKQGQLLNYVDVYVNRESSYPEELAKPVKDGDELHITLFVIAGG